MQEQDIRKAWNQTQPLIETIRKCHDGGFQVTFRLYTLAGQFISVYVRAETTGGYAVHDQRDLASDEYRVREGGSALPFLQAKDLQGRAPFSGIQEAGDTFFKRVTTLPEISEAMLVFAQFVQLAINQAILQREREDVIPPHTY